MLTSSFALSLSLSLCVCVCVFNSIPILVLYLLAQQYYRKSSRGMH